MEWPGENPRHSCLGGSLGTSDERQAACEAEALPAVEEEAAATFLFRAVKRWDPKDCSGDDEGGNNGKRDLARKVKRCEPNYDDECSNQQLVRRQADASTESTRCCDAARERSTRCLRARLFVSACFGFAEPTSHARLE